MSRGPATVALLLAAGEGRRIGGRKQFRRIAGRTLLEHALDGLFAVREVGGVVVVVPADRVRAVEKRLAERIPPARWWRVVAGGPTRHASSSCGLAALPAACRWVLIHDAARPFASPALLRRVLRAAREHGAAVPAIPVTDSTLEIDAAGDLRRYLRRERLRAVQTPQAFERTRLEAAFARARGQEFTDDASVVRRDGRTVVVVAGEADNRKITRPEDFEWARRRFARRAGGED